MNLNVVGQLKCALVLAGAAGLLACGPMEETEPGPAPCSGKCDGLSSLFKDLYSDMRKVDLGDLISVGAELATKQINDQLGNIPYAEIELAPTELYATSERASQDLTLNDLEKITSGLVAQYGDKEFVTRINQLRTQYLKQHPDHVFAEAAFEIGAQYAPSFSFEAGGYPGRLGFLASKGVKTTVTAPYKGELQAVLKGPINALKEMRGFALPRDVKEIRQMVPGETLAMHSDGTVGFNIGIGVPIYITTIESFATLHAVISAAAQASLTGQLDIQLIRDNGDGVVVDVGVTDMTNRFFQLAAKTRWGVEGLPEVKIKVGPLDIDAADLAEKALEDLLNKKLSLLSLGYQNSKEHVRHTVARFTFDLSKIGAGSPDALEQALVQALRGDIRLAQALANRPGSGVIQKLDLTRDARSLSSYFGLHFLSLRFFSEKKDKEGSVVITTGSESQQILFDELEKNSGFWQDTQGYKRRTLVSLSSVDGKLVDADVNFQIQLNENRQHAMRGQVLDHVDPLLALFVGRQRFIEKLGPAANWMQAKVDYVCPEPRGTGESGEPSYQQKKAYEECLKNAHNDPEVVKRRENAEAMFNSLVSQGIEGGMDPAFSDAHKFAGELFKLKLAVQGNPDGVEPWEEPKARMLVNFRLTEKALDAILASPDGATRFVEAFKDTIYIMDVSRRSTAAFKDGRDKVVNKFVENSQDVIKLAREQYEDRANRYQRLVNLKNVTYQSKAMGHTNLGNQAHLLVVEGSQDYAMATIAERKAETVAKLYDKLVKKLGWAQDFWLNEPQLVAYTLLGLASPAQLELLVNMDFKETEWADYPDTKLYGRGQQCKLVDAGQFSLESLINN